MFYLILLNLKLKSHLWLGASLLVSASLEYRRLGSRKLILNGQFRLIKLTSMSYSEYNWKGVLDTKHLNQNVNVLSVVLHRHVDVD
jgi:hypothetical protein